MLYGLEYSQFSDIAVLFFYEDLESLSEKNLDIVQMRMTMKWKKN